MTAVDERTCRRQDASWTDPDVWAVNVVVREGKMMNLGHGERVLAAHLMRARNFSIKDIADRLRVSDRVVIRYLKDFDPPGPPIAC